MGGTMTIRTGNQATNIGWQHYTGIFLLSLATLLLELALTRVLSVANWYHFGFLVVSTALLGFGASGVTLSLWTKLREEIPLDHALALLALLFGLITLASFWLMQRIPFNPFRLLLDRSQLAYTLLYYLALAAPFFCSGLAIALLLTRGGKEVNRIYAADLLGAGLGCAAVCGVMPAFGGSGTVVVAAMFGMLAALAFNSFRLSKLTLFGGVAAMGMLALAFVAEQALPIRVIPKKRDHPLLPVGRSPIYTKWNGFSRIDVYDAPALDEARPDPGFFSIIIDAGAAGTGMDDLSMGVRNYLAHAPDYHPAGLAYVGKDHPKVLIIGSGAGREVLEGLYFGASSITAVEINPIITDIVAKRMREHWGGLFEQPEVRLVTEDGRSFVRRSKEKYDAIISVNTMSSAALASGALALSETYLLTTEAFEDYWNHLTPNGTFLATGYHIDKLTATTRELFDRLGLGSPADHVFAFRGMGAPFGRVRLMPGFLLQKSPLRPDEVDIMAKRVGIGRNEHSGDTGQPEIYYSPFEAPRDQYQTLLAGLLKSPDLARIYASNADDLHPATDDKPFFQHRERWSNLSLSFRRVLGGGGRFIKRENGPVAEVALAVLLIQSVVVAGVMILLPLVRFNRQGSRASRRWAFLTYFACLGLGFILIEIVLLQRFLLFLGQPIYSFSVVLASLLIFTGAGSYLSSSIQNASSHTLSWFLLAVVGAILFVLVVTPHVLSLALGLALPLRVGVAVLLIAPLGVLLGVPFPIGLRVIGKEASSLVPWAWAVNSFFTVIGSAGAVILGMILGFTAVFIIAAASYAVALIAIRIGTAPRVAAYRSYPKSFEAYAVIR
jgi:Spermine/spermidine synthase domain